MKTRDLPIGSFIEILQHEAIQALIRSKVFVKSKDKKYWRTTYDRKKDKIIKMCEQNGVDHIFNSQEKWDSVVDSVIPEKGFPKFTYKNNEQQYGDGYHPGLEELDKRYYFNVDAEVVYDGQIYSIDLSDKESCTLRNKNNGSILRVPKSELRRLLILSE